MKYLMIGAFLSMAVLSNCSAQQYQTIRDIETIVTAVDSLT